MPIRDIAIILMVVLCAGAGFLRPWIGVCGFAWVSYMNPHRFTWSAAYTFPVALMIAGATLGGMVLGRGRIRFPKEKEALILIALWVTFTISPIWALYPDSAWTEWVKISKILLMTFVTMALIYERKTLNIFANVIVISIGLLALKSAVFGLATGGEYRVWGPPESFLEDNNDFAHAITMAIPLIVWSASQAKPGICKNFFRLLVPSAVLSVLLTYSRGGLLSLLAVLGHRRVYQEGIRSEHAWATTCKWPV